MVYEQVEQKSDNSMSRQDHSCEFIMCSIYIHIYVPIYVTSSQLATYLVDQEVHGAVAIWIERTDEVIRTIPR